MKSYLTLRAIVIGDTRHDKGVTVELIEKQAAAFMAAGHIEPVEPASETGDKPAPKAKTSTKEAAE